MPEYKEKSYYSSDQSDVGAMIDRFIDEDHLHQLIFRCGFQKEEE